MLYSSIICALVLGMTAVHSKYTYLDAAQRFVAEHKMVATWDEARQCCDREGAILASPISPELLQYMTSRIQVNGHSGQYFIGVKAVYEYHHKPIFISIEGTIADDLPQAAIDMIEALDPRNGDCLAMNPTSITVVPCWSRLPFICYTHVTPNTTVLPIVKPVLGTPGVVSSTEFLRCTGAGYQYYPSVGCYKIHKWSSMWDEGKKTCADEGGYLVILDDEKEAHAISGIFGRRIDTSATWVGIRDDGRHGGWRTIKGECIDDKYKVWANYSLNFSGGRSCGGLNKDMELVQYGCVFELTVICEKDV